MQVLVLSDGRPGHFKQSQGVVKALQRHVSLDEKWVELKLRLGLNRELLKQWLNFGGVGLSPAALRWFYRLRDLSDLHPDIIVSSGGKTSFANACLAQHWNCQNIFIGSLRGLKEELFTRIVTLDSSKESDPRYIVTPLPTAVNPRSVKEQARQYLDENQMMPARRRWLLLVGGDGGGYSYASDEWARLIDAIKLFASQYDVRWLISTSRRTPPHVERLFKSLSGLREIEDLIVYNEAPRPLFGAFLGCAELVFCTEDSAMMMTEAVSAGRRVCTIRPRRSRPACGNYRLLDLYERQNLICRMTLEQLAVVDLEAAKRRLCTMPGPPMENLWHEIGNFVKAV